MIVNTQKFLFLQNLNYSVYIHSIYKLGWPFQM